jgi:hypothetical protein
MAVFVFSVSFWIILSVSSISSCWALVDGIVTMFIESSALSFSVMRSISGLSFLGAGFTVGKAPTADVVFLVTGLVVVELTILVV